MLDLLNANSKGLPWTGIPWLLINPQWSCEMGIYKHKAERSRFLELSDAFWLKLWGPFHYEAE